MYNELAFLKEYDGRLSILRLMVVWSEACATNEDSTNEEIYEIASHEANILILNNR